MSSTTLIFISPTINIPELVVMSCPRSTLLNENLLVAIDIDSYHSLLEEKYWKTNPSANKLKILLRFLDAFSPSRDAP